MQVQILLDAEVRCGSRRPRIKKAGNPNFPLWEDPDFCVTHPADSIRIPEGGRQSWTIQGTGVKDLNRRSAIDHNERMRGRTVSL
ncbi:hypothetical protein B6K86_09010 [Lachnospiraceae bacterium]|nr:hypothetical protein B6K86_09010 [Lachnospiraceae bacterium]